MKILYLSQRFPNPPDRGDRIPTFNHIKHLSRKHSVHVASLLADQAETVHVQAFAQWAASSLVEIQSPWKSLLGKIKALLLGQPLSLGHYRNPALLRRVKAFVASEGIEAVIVFSTSMAQYVEGITGIVRIMNFCDLDSQKWSDLSKVNPWPRSWIYRREAKLLLAYERKIAGSFDFSCMVTEQEAALFRRFIPGVKVPVLANGVDHDFFGAVEWRPAKAHLVFVGVMDYEPNVEAVCFFVNEVWPLVRNAFPEAVFTIVGSRPNAKVRELAAIPGIKVTGFVPDVRIHLATATLVVVPLKVARGIQNKILEAMSAGVPVLTTPMVALGITPDFESLLFTAERNREAFAARIIELLKADAATREQAERARAFVQRHFSWHATGVVLENLLEEGRNRAAAQAGSLAPVKLRA